MEQKTMKLKLLDLIYDMITTKKSNLPIYHGNDSKEFVPACTSENKPVVCSVMANINMPALHAFIRRLSEDKRVGLAGIAVMKDDRLIAEHYVKPYSNQYRHVSFSMCKSVISMAVGIAVQDKILRLDEKLVDIFPEYTGFFTKKEMKKVTVSHLLTMTSGVKFDEVSSYFAEDWIKAFMSSDFAFPPGDDFTYNSLNTYMLAAIITKRAGCSVLAYLKSRLFYPLGIRDITWDCCPKGIERGGWGMKLSLQDMIKLGELYLNDGAVIRNGKKMQLISRKYIRESVQSHVVFEDAKLVKGYGYQIWCLKDGAFLFNGVFGQNVYINRKKRLVIACMAAGYEVFPEGHLMEMICGFVADDSNFKRKPVQTVMESVLKKREDFYWKQKSRKTEPLFAAYLYHNLKPYIGKKYRICDYASSILPIANQIFYSSYMTGMEQLGFAWNDGNPILHVMDGKQSFQIRLGYLPSKPYIYQMLDINGKMMPVAAGLELADSDTGGCGFVVRIVYLEEVANKIIHLSFHQECVQIRAVDTPNMMKFMQKLFGESMMQRTKKLGRFKKSYFINEKLKKVLFPNSEGIAR